MNQNNFKNKSSVIIKMIKNNFLKTSYNLRFIWRREPNVVFLSLGSLIYTPDSTSCTDQCKTCGFHQEHCMRFVLSNGNLCFVYI